MDNLISYINRKVKKIEKHLDIKLNIQDEVITTLFKQFISFSYDNADFVLCSAEKPKKHILHYDFNTGHLTDTKSGEEIEIEDRFSRRHLCSILFSAHKVLFLKSSNNVSPLTEKIHKENPVPIMVTEFGNGKKWFSIESIDVVTDSHINMKGLLSIDKNDIHQPVKAACVFNIKKAIFKWEYKLYGEQNKEKEAEKYYSWYRIKMRDVLYAYTEVIIKQRLNIKCHTPTQALEHDMLSILKIERIHFFTKREPGRSYLKIDYICGLFWGIKVITEKQIVLLACDGKTLSKEIIFERINRNIYADIPGSGRKRCLEMLISQNDKMSYEKFYKVIRLIEKRLKAST